MSQILITTVKGLDELLVQEVTKLCPDATVRLSANTVIMDGSLSDAYTVCLWSRLANRVIWVLHEGPANDAQSLYDTADRIDWPCHLTENHTLSVQFVGTSRAINNTQFGAVKIKDAIVDQFTQTTGKRPSVSKLRPDVPVYARLRKDKVVIGIDLSGTSLHQRAYRQDTGEAPLKEHIASAMLLRSGWVDDENATLVDPMCGSGTIAIEAALMARNIAPGIKRNYWGFEKWLGHQPQLWQQKVDSARGNALAQSPRKIYAFDNNKNVLSIARTNADHAGVFSDILFQTADAVTLMPPEETGYIVSNPPYGERLGELNELIPLFSKWGSHFKQHWAGWHISLLSSNRDLLSLLKLRSAKSYSMNNGKLECQLVNYYLDDDNIKSFKDEADNPFANRIRKNLKKLKRFINRNHTECYRIYDADLPEYNVAIDRYADYLVVQEYAPPKDIPPEKARRRLQDILLYLPAVTGVSGKNIVLKVREQQKGKKQYEKLAKTDRFFTVMENGARLRVNVHDYLDTGLFLDHRDTRQLIQSMSKDKDVLNLFCYTGSVSVFAALGKARSVTSVDMSNTYLDWAKSNFSLNKLNGPFAFIQADCTEWLKQHKGRYDLMFIDPPSFSNSKRMAGTWDVQRDHVELLKNALKLLKPGGTIVFSNNRRGFKLDEAALQTLGVAIKNITDQTIPEDFARQSRVHQCWTITQ